MRVKVLSALINSVSKLTLIGRAQMPNSPEYSLISSCADTFLNVKILVLSPPPSTWALPGPAGFAAVPLRTSLGNPSW
jgi:hypothetical protein